MGRCAAATAAARCGGASPDYHPCTRGAEAAPLVTVSLPMAPLTMTNQVPLLNGFDTNGGRRPREVRWRWDACYLVITPALVPSFHPFTRCAGGGTRRSPTPTTRRLTLTLTLNPNPYPNPNPNPDPDHAQRGLNCRVWLGSAAAGLQLNLQGTEQVMTLLACDHPWPRVT